MIDGDDGVLGRTGQVPESFLHLGPGLFRGLSSGHVAEDGAGGDRLPFLKLAVDVPFHVDPASILGQKHGFHLLHNAARDNLSKHLPAVGQAFRSDDVEQGQAGHLFPKVAEGLQPFSVDEQKVALR